MNISGLLPLIEETRAFQQLVDAIEQGEQDDVFGAQNNPGVITAARPFLVAALYRKLGRPILVLTARAERVGQWVEQLSVWTGSGAVYRFPEPDALPYERVPWSRETITDRLSALTAFARWNDSRATLTAEEVANTPPLLIASARALMHKTLPMRELRMGLREYRQGQEIDLRRTLGLWVANGYRPESVVEEPGTFGRRGGLVDVFPSNEPYPVRIELFGDEIDSLRVFDPTTQRSLDRIERFVLAPATEALPRLAPPAAQRLSGAEPDMEALDLSLCHPPARMEYERDMEALEHGTFFRGIEFYLPLLYSHPATVLSYLPPGGLCIVDDWSALVANVEEMNHQAQTLRADLVKAGELPSNFPAPGAPHFSWQVLDEALLALGERGPLVLGGIGVQDRPEPSSIGRAFSLGERFGGQLKRVLDGCQEMREAGDRVVLVTRQARRISELLAEQDIAAKPVEKVTEPPAPGSLTLVQGTLAEGWTLRPGVFQEPATGVSTSTGPALRVLTDAEVFGWARPVPRRARRHRPVAPEAFFADVQPGSYVVHVEHGIGLFQGLTKMAFSGGEREYLLVEYSAGDKLYVPVYQADRLSRYVGAGEESPRVNRLGTAEWGQVKAKAKKAVEEIADDLLVLYSAREVVEGHAFSPDTFWQAELEASFPYIETEAQLHTLDEIKADMERARPMDRLVCGDVGYGKTEVALRAAFKAVMDGKQVAVLVPTTVLAQQHFHTFSQRLTSFPVSVRMLSRFLSRKKQEDVVERLVQGSVDIVIGTHRLLSEDVRFKDLGLLVIDEEQRFGVAHKERLKQMRQEVDVLTLTATPIPRTLHMSLTGVRDMSTIDTPPEERLPVRTHVGEYDETLIRQAILRELDRGGQVYFVHNRVMGIYQMAQRLRKLVPEAQISVAHGQMAERELEQGMLEFAAGSIEVLVCTSIIESGLDIPNVNTLIVNRAERFGLAQLYQLRGRVGRGARRAYAYFLHPKATSLSEIARQRLQTIHEATDLGAGFHIAMRDLEIRGAGELLGSRQHGHIAAVGFDLYTRLLAQSVQEARTQKQIGGTDHGKRWTDNEAAAYVQPLEQTVQISLPLAAYLPDDYVADSVLRLRLYRRLAGVTSEEEIGELRTELVDRFGPIPEETENLLFQLRLKLHALAAGARAIATEEGQVVIRADTLEELDRAWLQRRLADRARVARRAVWLPLTEDDRWRTTLATVLQAIAEGLG